VSVAACNSGKCADPVSICASTSAPFIDACKAHGGTQ
jgi:hypothetical protein